jgi:N-acetylmuramoyl-L-alanine amidase
MLVGDTTAARAVLLILALLLPGRAEAGPVVVLDPGHGGTNFGALGPETQVYEKRLTLALARRTASYLRQWIPAATIVLTRSKDEYLTLEQRVRRANAAHGELFVSLHLNASENRDRQGFETFLLSREASAQEAARLAAEGGTPSRPALQAILRDLRQSATHGEAARLAQALQSALERVRGPARSRGVRQAPFDVLMGLRMPGVLVEAGFIDHPVEGRDLVRRAVQEQLAAAIASGIVAYLEDDTR